MAATNQATNNICDRTITQLGARMMILWCSAFGMIIWNKASFTMVKVAILPELQKKGEQACYQGNDTNFFRSDQTSSHVNATREISFEFLCLNSAACFLLAHLWEGTKLTRRAENRGLQPFMGQLTIRRGLDIYLEWHVISFLEFNRSSYID
ncbi:hypothetical protein NA56DRAFT_87735 [Hyaloscypha hepaticicola]|uniref:Uncharacterized protein n=1 Tax=Hyaloscypha hepaticicola TaxID=2082293 RepID=A0A2J6Q882_9HELO|nr:hypothetical protein NA56DRAFT_87735 [Hyaloscypha hepaticicola]